MNMLTSTLGFLSLLPLMACADTSQRMSVAPISGDRPPLVVIQEALARCQELGDVGSVALQLQCLQEACENVQSLAGRHSMVYDKINAAIALAQTRKSDAAAVDDLHRSLDAAKTMLMFRPIMESSMPHDYPLPGHVGVITVKEYPVARMAQINSSGQSRNGMFMPLFKHIKRNDIAMTTPVHMGYNVGDADGSDTQRANVQSMAFVYKATTIGQAGSDSTDSRISVDDTPGMKVVSIGMVGTQRSASTESMISRLNRWLEDQSDYQAAGPPRVLGYNSPFVPSWLRFSEIQIPIEPKPGATE